MDDLAFVGISMNAVTDQLTDGGVKLRRCVRSAAGRHRSAREKRRGSAGIPMSEPGTAVSGACRSSGPTP
jgi:hypothetical protein